MEVAESPLHMPLVPGQGQQDPHPSLQGVCLLDYEKSGVSGIIRPDSALARGRRTESLADPFHQLGMVLVAIKAEGPRAPDAEL